MTDAIKTAALRWFKPEIYLVDVSGWQKPHNCDWLAAWEDGCVGAIVKRSQGRGVTSSGAEHSRRLAESPVARGDYHFADTRDHDDYLHPEKQADTFCCAVGELDDDDLIPWLDAEWIKDCEHHPNTDWILTWCDYVRQRLACHVVGIYTLATYAQSMIRACDEIRALRLWLAAAGRDPQHKLAGDRVPTVADVDAGWVRGKYGERYPVPEMWDEWSLYQWTGSGRVGWYRGGKGKIDRNLPRHWLGTLQDLRVGTHRAKGVV